MPTDLSKRIQYANQRPMRPPLPTRITVTVAVVALFIPALYLPAYWARGGFFEGGTELAGWMLLVFGWVPPFTLVWPANVVLYDSQRRFWGGYPYAAVEGGAAAALGLVPTLEFVFDTSGHSQLRVGYFLWAGSLVANFVGISSHAIRTGAWRRKNIAAPVMEFPIDRKEERFFAGRSPTGTAIRADVPPAGSVPSIRRPGIPYRLATGVIRRLIAAVPVGLFAYVQYEWFLHDRRMNPWHKPYVVLGPLYFLANDSPADDWIGYTLLAVAVPCLLAVVVWPRRWTVLLACATGLVWVVPGCIDAPGGP